MNFRTHDFVSNAGFTYHTTGDNRYKLLQSSMSSYLKLPNWQTSYKIGILIPGDIEHRMKRLLDYLRDAVAEMASK